MAAESIKPPTAGPYYIGLMSGTSLDGVDAVLADFTQSGKPAIIAHASFPMPHDLRTEFLALNHPGENELERAAIAGNRLADLYTMAAHQVLDLSGLQTGQIAAIGAHGQTVRHDPEAGYTIQINAPARLAEHTGIAVIADFRSRDIAAGGQGAPLVPAFHHALFADPDTCRVVLNLGGIANVTILAAGQVPWGFDTGPANVLLDTWIHERQGLDYDRDGAWAATGKINDGLLGSLIGSERWLDSTPPKSTGRHLFNATWLQKRLSQWQEQAGPLPDADVQATLQAFTARTVAMAIQRHAPDTREIIVCGGGALNTGLMNDLNRELPGITCTTTTDYGIPVQLVEALAFAWLAWAWDHHHPASLPQVTGAREPRVLGCRYPA